MGAQNDQAKKNDSKGPSKIKTDLAIPFYGYKTHIAIDAGNGLIRAYDVTTARKHEMHVFENLLDDSNLSSKVYADSGYRSSFNEEMLKRKKISKVA